MRDNELIEEMKHYLAGAAQKGMYKKGLVNLRELSEFDLALSMMMRLTDSQKVMTSLSSLCIAHRKSCTA
jgi:hypothetical protein